jgi:hypothetical protein
MSAVYLDIELDDVEKDMYLDIEILDIKETDHHVFHPHLARLPDRSGRPPHRCPPPTQSTGATGTAAPHGPQPFCGSDLAL